MEYIDSNLNLADVGGLQTLKKWLELRSHCFGDTAKEFGVKPPKGVLLTGVPGCGKSLTAKCVASAWNMPLLRLDMGKIFQGVVGSSESNIRLALKTAEAVAPSILWIDETQRTHTSFDTSTPFTSINGSTFFIINETINYI